MQHKKKKKISHSGAALSAMKVMMVVMVMALLTTTSHSININGSIVGGGGYSSSTRCNGLTATACRIAYSELDFDLEFMLDSEFSISLLADGGSYHPTDTSRERGNSASCNRFGTDDPCHGRENKNIPPGCKDPTDRSCNRHN
ncbi:hypothetical protein Pyn_09705 [Prunus yedoensis var. nudiflora]|uniref:Uncharacterized protein n=1 Tax=Prunus yedoensis var. nudiflora TaxID=2094558 RepID=A0A314UEK0_PRUYE|nr:hypothetical protein Pyn_09705 [Prunus yedoensis var. nudiflora]